MSVYKDILSENGYDIDAPITVHEVYFGKNKYLLEAEKVLGRLRKNYLGADEVKLNKAKEILEFNRLMEKAFKLECFCLTVIHSGLFNANTLAIGTVIDAPNYKGVKSNEIGFNWDYIKDSTIIVNVNSGLLTNSNITDGEVMAVILHEIGHNFDTSISSFCRGSSYIIKVLALITMPIGILTNPDTTIQLTRGGRRWYTNLLRDWREKGNIFVDLIDSFRYAFSKILTLVAVPMHMFMNIRSMLTPMIPLIDISTAEQLALGALKFRSEALADNFATAYGYGPELQSFMVKLKYKAGGWADEELMRNIPVIGTWLDLSNMPTHIIQSIVADHPDYAFRCKDQINMLKRELDRSDLDPKMKGIIRNDIKEIEKSLNKLLDYTKTGWMYTTAWSAFLMTICNGDVKSFLAKGLYDEFDKAYDKNLEVARKIKDKNK